MSREIVTTAKEFLKQAHEACRKYALQFPKEMRYKEYIKCLQKAGVKVVRE